MAGNDQFDGMGTMGAEMRCSFCGKTRSQVSKLIAGPGGVYICDECVHACSDMIDEAEFPDDDEALELEEGVPPIKDLPTPHEIYDELSQYVMGQEQAKRAMSVAGYNHYRRILSGNDEVEEGEEAETHTVEVTVKGIKVRNTPELTDELVKSDFGFDSIDAMRDAIKIEIEQDKASRLPAEKENRCVSALAERLQLDEMDADYEQSVFEELGQNFLSNLAARGMTLDTWLPASGLTMEQFIGDLHKQANDVARESLALDALARELKIEVTEDDINAEFEKAGVKDVEASKAEFIADGRMPAVRESIRRSKAVDHLVENAKVTEVDETAKDAE